MRQHPSQTWDEEWRRLFREEPFITRHTWSDEQIAQHFFNAGVKRGIEKADNQTVRIKGVR